MTVRRNVEVAFNRLPAKIRHGVLHRMGRFAPWESGFDFTPPTLNPGERIGPPDFVGIGVQKAGTTWWFDLLSTHSDIWTPEGIHKERHFLDRFGSIPFGPRDVEAYHGWFPRPDGARTGEWTPDYFSLPWVPGLLKQAAPDARLLLLLRDPIERFESGLAHQRRMGTLGGTASTVEALRRGFYHQTLDEWLAHFDRSQILILQYERCAAEPAAQLESTFAFLGLPDDPAASSVRPRPSAPARANGLDPDVRERLVEVYEADVRALIEDVDDLDLSLWPNFSYLVGDAPSPSGSPNSPT